jgi:hypothetical protein
MNVGAIRNGSLSHEYYSLHLQRRFEQRWAARFGSLVIPAVPKKRRIERPAVNIAPRAAKPKKNPPVRSEVCLCGRLTRRREPAAPGVPAGAYYPSTFPRINSRLRPLETHTQNITAPGPDDARQYRASGPWRRLEHF